MFFVLFEAYILCFVAYFVAFACLNFRYKYSNKLKMLFLLRFMIPRIALLFILLIKYRLGLDLFFCTAYDVTGLKGEAKLIRVLNV